MDFLTQWAQNCWQRIKRDHQVGLRSRIYGHLEMHHDGEKISGERRRVILVSLASLSILFSIPSEAEMFSFKPNASQRFKGACSRVVENTSGVLKRAVDALKFQWQMTFDPPPEAVKLAEARKRSLLWNWHSPSEQKDGRLFQKTEMLAHAIYGFLDEARPPQLSEMILRMEISASQQKQFPSGELSWLYGTQDHPQAPELNLKPILSALNYHPRGEASAGAIGRSLGLSGADSAKGTTRGESTIGIYQVLENSLLEMTISKSHLRAFLKYELSGLEKDRQLYLSELSAGLFGIEGLLSSIYYNGMNILAVGTVKELDSHRGMLVVTENNDNAIVLVFVPYPGIARSPTEISIGSSANKVQSAREGKKGQANSAVDTGANSLHEVEGLYLRHTDQLKESFWELLMDQKIDPSTVVRQLLEVESPSVESKWPFLDSNDLKLAIIQFRLDLGGVWPSQEINYGVSGKVVAWPEESPGSTKGIEVLEFNPLYPGYKVLRGE